MNNPIAHPDFLLDNDPARQLYHDYAAPLPIIDYHNHLPVAEIASNRKFANLTPLWLDDDHYKYRAMRANGVPETCITGQASDRDKFDRWAATVPYTLRNPLYHWTHLELKKPFGITGLLDESSAGAIFEQTAELLQQDEFRVQGLLKQFNVEVLVTTDDPTDSLDHHRQLAQEGHSFNVSTSWRCDRLFNIRNLADYNQYLDKLARVSDTDIGTYPQLLDAIRIRHQYFHDHGARISDGGLEFPFPTAAYTGPEVEASFARIRSRKEVSAAEKTMVSGALLRELSEMNAEKNWVQQFHIGAYRDVNTRGVLQVGQAKGYDSIHDFTYAASMGTFLNALEEAGMLAKTILYHLNPRDSHMVAAMAGNFQDGTVPGKIQYGAAWWFLDTKTGIENHLATLSDMGLLRRFVGMLTDSRSFLSFSRHEYFRRILCNTLGHDVEQGLLPRDLPLLGKMVTEICHTNAQHYFTLTES